MLLQTRLLRLTNLSEYSVAAQMERTSFRQQPVAIRTAIDVYSKYALRIQASRRSVLSANLFTIPTLPSFIEDGSDLIPLNTFSGIIIILLPITDAFLRR
jgi:hypothetical protein